MERIPNISVSSKPLNTSGSCLSSRKSFSAHLRSPPCLHCQSIPPTLMINTTLLCHSGSARSARSAHTKWKWLSSPEEITSTFQLSKADPADSDPDIDHHQDQSPESPSKLSFFGEMPMLESKGSMCLKNRKVNVNMGSQTDVSSTNESTQVHVSDLDEFDPHYMIGSLKKSPVTRGRGGRGRRGRGGGRQRRGALRAAAQDDESQQTRSFRPRKSTSYVELPDDVEDVENDDAESVNIAAQAQASDDTQDYDSMSSKKYKKMMKKRAQQKSQSVERDEACEEVESSHGKNPLLLKLAKKTNSGAEWKVETVTKVEELSKKMKSETLNNADSSSHWVRKIGATSTVDCDLSEQEHSSFVGSLSDSELAKSPTSPVEGTKTDSSLSDNTQSSPQSAGVSSSPGARRAKGPLSKLLASRKRRRLILPKKSGVLFRKAMKECTAKSKMQTSASVRGAGNSPKEPAPASSSKETSVPSPKECAVVPPLPLQLTSQASKPESFPSLVEEVKPPTRSAIFTLDKKGAKKGRIKERRKTEEAPQGLSKGKFRCNLCHNYFQTRLAAKKHWLNFHHVPGGSTSPSRDISEHDMDFIAEVSEAPSPTMPPVTPTTPSVPAIASFQVLPPVPALHSISSVSYAVPAPAPSISSCSYAPPLSTLPAPYHSAIVPNPLVASASVSEPDQKAPLDLPVRFLDTI